MPLDRNDHVGKDTTGSGRAPHTPTTIRANTVIVPDPSWRIRHYQILPDSLEPIRQYPTWCRVPATLHGSDEYPPSYDVVIAGWYAAPESEVPRLP